MRQRTRSRECALQVLYQVDIRRFDAQEALAQFWEQHQAPQEVREFASQLVNGTMTHLSEIDLLIASHADNWDLPRMAIVDRNILRLGTFELLHLAEVPPKVCINEAVELAKRFGDSESGRFINGILDAIHRARARQAPPAPPASEGESRGE